MTGRLFGQVVPFPGDPPPKASEADLSACGRTLLAQAEITSGPPCVSTPCCPPEPVTLQVATDESHQFTDVAWRLPAQIVNAQKGDLFLCPGGSMGKIGGLLSALDPPQHYTHMGIFVDDGGTIRHCTMSDEQANESIGGFGDLVGKLATHQAFSDLQTRALQYGWPGRSRRLSTRHGGRNARKTASRTRSGSTISPRTGRTSSRR
jgi:hypothetical protein